MEEENYAGSVKGTILVSHSGKQYVHRVVQGLLSNRWRVIFCAPIWFQRLPFWLPWLPSWIKQKLTIELKKRLFSFKGSMELVTWPLIAIRKEIEERIPSIGISGAQLKLEKRQDDFTVKQLKRCKPEIVLGYEISSMKTFRVARSRNIITVLDLAQIHYQDVLEIAQSFPEMSYILKNPYLAEINSRKQTEYELADFIITLSSFASKSMINRGIPSEKVYEINLGFDLEVFTPKIEYSSSKELRLLICGTDMWRKGLGLLIQVVKQMELDGYNLKLTIVGPTIEIYKIIRQHGRPSNTEIYDFMSHDELVKKYQQADVFVFPSYLDSWAMTVLEAMACGTPVIITENIGSKDAVIKGGGKVIPSGDKNVLKNAIAFFYNQREEVEASGKKAREIALQYTWENYNRQIEEVMKDIQRKSE